MKNRRKKSFSTWLTVWFRDICGLSTETDLKINFDKINLNYPLYVFLIVPNYSLWFKSKVNFIM